MRVRYGTNGDSAGFTLIEVLLALGIFVAAAAILSRLVLVGLESAESARLRTQAWAIAESHFAELDAGLITVDDSGAYAPEGFEDWQVTMTVASADIDFLLAVTVEVQNVSSGPGAGFLQRYQRFVFDEEAAQEVADAANTQETAE